MENKLDFAEELHAIALEVEELKEQARRDSYEVDNDSAWAMFYYSEWLAADMAAAVDKLRGVDLDTPEGAELADDVISALAVRLYTMGASAKQTKGMRACAALAAELSEELDDLSALALRHNLDMRKGA